MITEEAINRLRGLKDELFCIQTDTTNKNMERSVCIPRVPLWLRENKGYTECFDPAVVSIGPYHHDKPKLARIEKLKIISAQRFVAGCKSSMDVIYSNLKSLTSEAKKCYDDSIIANIDDEAFTVMMLLDGCFIMEFILQLEFGKEWNQLMTLKNDIPLISRDLLLLENQLPYPILKELVDCHPGLNSMVNRYINSEIGETYEMYLSPSAGQNRDQQMPSLPYILNLFHAKLVGDKLIIHFQHGEMRRKRSYPPAKELLTKGITFKRKNSICLCDVEFRSHLLSRELLLPQIEINHYTKDKFLDLIAYELSCDVPKNRSFIAFICFLDTLIDHADDVKVLRSEGIICNYLGSDEEVANLVNELATGLIHDPFAYSKIVDEIQSHIKKWWRVQIGEFMYTHFRSPWTTFALIAACYVILVTSIQTYFSVFPR